jgi:hypothetical protein
MMEEFLFYRKQTNGVKTIQNAASGLATITQIMDTTTNQLIVSWLIIQ